MLTVPAMSVNCATAFIAIVAATVLRIILVRANKRLDRGEDVGDVSALGQAGSRGFRYLV